MKVIDAKLDRAIVQLVNLSFLTVGDAVVHAADVVLVDDGVACTTMILVPPGRLQTVVFLRPPLLRNIHHRLLSHWIQMRNVAPLIVVHAPGVVAILDSVAERRQMRA